MACCEIQADNSCPMFHNTTAVDARTSCVSVCMSVCACACACVHVRVHVHVYAHVQCMCICVHAHVRVHVYVRVHAHVSECEHVGVSSPFQPPPFGPTHQLRMDRLGCRTHRRRPLVQHHRALLILTHAFGGRWRRPAPEHVCVCVCVRVCVCVCVSRGGTTVCLERPRPVCV
jgi:hypothetical protein